jgi:hypothetical protein
VDRAPGLVQAVVGDALSLLEDAQRPVDVTLVRQDRPGGLDLDPERPERVRQNVVDLAGDPGPLVQHRDLTLTGPQLLDLSEQGGRLLGLHAIRAPGQAPQQRDDEQQRVAERESDARRPHQDTDLDGHAPDTGDHPAGDQAGLSARRQRCDQAQRDQAGPVGGGAHPAGRGGESQRGWEQPHVPGGRLRLRRPVDRRDRRPRRVLLRLRALVRPAARPLDGEQRRHRRCPHRCPAAHGAGHDADPHPRTGRPRRPAARPDRRRTVRCPHWHPRRATGQRGAGRGGATADSWLVSRPAWWSGCAARRG